MQVITARNHDLSENVHYNNMEFPAYIKRGNLSAYNNYSAISHWHDDVEFIRVESGELEYNINGTNEVLRQGEGLFVNTRQLHYGFSRQHRECIFICILLHPLLLCSSPYVEERYVRPVLENTAMPYLLLHPDIERESDILSLLGAMYHSYKEDTFALRAQGLFFTIWEKLYLLSDHMEEKAIPKNHQLTQLKDMIQFIYHHYSEKITLDQIAREGGVGKTSCCTIFKKYANESPIAYLTDYRIKKSTELLKTTDWTIAEICFEVGFSGASYFTETFRKSYGCTPSQYRENKSNQIESYYNV